MRAFVTGGTGFLGQALIRELLDHGYAVTALVRTYERARQLPAGVRAVPGDITRPATFTSGLRGADVVFHLAALTALGLKPGDQERLERITVQGTRHILEQAAAAGVERVVYAACVAARGDTQGQTMSEAWPGATVLENAAQRAKRAAQDLVGAPAITASLGTLYGPGDRAGLGRWLRRLQRGQLPVMLGPEAARAWTYVDDAAAGLRLTAERGQPGEPYCLAGPAHTRREVLTMAAHLAGRPAPYLWLPGKVSVSAARLLARLRPAWAEHLRELGPATYLAHADKAQRALGWTARPLAAGLPPTLAWLKENP